MPRVEPNTRTAQYVQAYCDREKITQTHLAELLGVNSITLSRWMRGVYPVGIPWVADELEDLIGIAPPRTRAELDEQLRSWPEDRLKPVVLPTVIAGALAIEKRRVRDDPRRRRHGRGRG